MAQLNIKRMIKEEGIVVEKILKNATKEFPSSDGRLIPAQPERYILKVISGEEKTKENGYISCTMQEFKVEKAMYDKAVLFTPVIVKFEMSTNGLKPDSITFKE